MWDDLPKKEPRKRKRKKPENFSKRSTDRWTEAGWTVARVEHHDLHSGKTHDLYGFADLILFIPSVKPVVLVQVCGKGDRNKRFRKITSNKNAYDWLSGDVDRHIWVEYWSQQTTKEPNGTEVRRWVADLMIVTLKDFNLCQLNQEQDVGSQGALDWQIETGDASSTAKKETGLELKNNLKLGNVIHFTGRKNGSD